MSESTPSIITRWLRNMRRQRLAWVTVSVILGIGMLTRAQQPPATQTASANTVTRVYDIRDLLVSVDFDLPPAMKADEWGFPIPSTNPSGKPVETATAQREKLTTDLIRKLQGSIAMDSWKDNGGQVGTVRSLNGQLIIAQTPENQELIAAILDSWRSEYVTQVSLESRFVTGIDDLIRAPAVQGKWVDENGVRRWSEFLSDEQVALLLRAMQTRQNTTTLTAPRLTLFNRQRAYVVVQTSTAYVASVTPKKQDDGITKFDPITKSVPSGLLHDCRVTLSNDKTIVKVELHTRFNRVIEMESVASPESDPKNPAFYQVPHVSAAAIDTTIDVPDGKTTLLQITPQLKPAKEGAPAQQPQFVLVKPTVVLNR